MEINGMVKRSVNIYSAEIVERLKKITEEIGMEMTNGDKEILISAVKNNLTLFLNDVQKYPSEVFMNPRSLGDCVDSIYNGIFLPYFNDKGVEIFSMQKPRPEGKEFFLTEDDYKKLINKTNEAFRQFVYSADHSQKALRDAEDTIKKDFSEFLKRENWDSDKVDILKERYEKGHLTMEDFLKEYLKLVELQKLRESNPNKKYILTDEGKQICKCYLDELQAKRKVILDARLDTADEVNLPTMEDLENDIAFIGLDEDNCYYNCWAVTDNYDADTAISLELNRDFVENIRYKEDIEIERG